MSIVKQRLKKDGEEGFTLIELMVVVLILGILMAIAIPTFLSLTSSAKKNAAQADLTTAITDAAVNFTANGTYGTDTTDAVAQLTKEDGNITWVNDNGYGTNGAAGQKQVLVNIDSSNPDGTVIDLGVVDKNGNYYWAQDSSGTTTYSDATTGNGAPSGFPNSSMP